MESLDGTENAILSSTIDFPLHTPFLIGSGEKYQYEENEESLKLMVSFNQYQATVL